MTKTKTYHGDTKTRRQDGQSRTISPETRKESPNKVREGTEKTWSFISRSDNEVGRKHDFKALRSTKERQKQNLNAEAAEDTEETHKRDAPAKASGNRAQLLNYPIPRSLFHGNSQGFHLPVKVAALQAERFCRPGHVAVVIIELLQDVVAFIGGASLVER